ncbi:MAG: hypothetical protein HQL58_09710 [Magnetococcales bacterium]|nr:hypothetical protein [Magnetococcales bacterium]
MTIWNFLVILCFIILYMAIALVFLQIRRLQDEWRLERDKNRDLSQTDAFRCEAEQLIGPLLQKMESMNESQQRLTNELMNESVQKGVAFVVERAVARIDTLEQRLLVDINQVPERMKSEFEELRSGIRLLARHDNSDHNVAPIIDTSDSYREARLLLSHGVDEEHVSSGTGLTMEEVGLIKSMLLRSGPKDSASDNS